MWRHSLRFHCHSWVKINHPCRWLTRRCRHATRAARRCYFWTHFAMNFITAAIISSESKRGDEWKRPNQIFFSDLNRWWHHAKYPYSYRSNRSPRSPRSARTHLGVGVERTTHAEPSTVRRAANADLCVCAGFLHSLSCAHREKKTSKRSTLARLRLDEPHLLFTERAKIEKD